MTTEIDIEKQPEVENPVLVEGLAGIGHIGKTSVSYLADHLGAEKIGEIHSDHFPPYAMVKDDKSLELMKNNVYQYGRDDGQDLLIVEGNAQSSSPEGHYILANEIIDFCEETGVEEIITIGGYGTGDVVEEPEVYGAVSSAEHKENYGDHGIEFDHEVGQVVGASGLLIGVGKRKGIEGLCLLGETPGFLLSDPKATEEVLKVLEEVLELNIEYGDLEEKIEESQEVLKKLQNLHQTQGQDQESQGSDLGYIG